jgi:16S rRNA (guanine(527)-N(7))-methyltransferase RsmG
MIFGEYSRIMAAHDRQFGAHTAAPGVDELGRLLGTCGLRLNAAQLEQLWMYHCLLREHNPELNLTRVHNFANMVLKLYADSILPADMVPLPSPLLDLGTGPGMPGIPLKIYRPDIEVLLGETRAKRVAFLHLAVERLGLEGIRVVAGRVSPHFEEPVGGVITRAVEPVADTLERVQGCLAAGGQVLCMKGPHCDAEIAAAGERFKGAYVLALDRPYRIPHTRHERRLLVYRRLDEPYYSRKAKAMIDHPVRTITSGQNTHFKEMKKLLTGRGVRKGGKALVGGNKPVGEVLANHPNRCEAWISSTGQAPPPPHSPPQLMWFELDPGLFDELDVSGTHAPLLLIRLPEIPAWHPTEGFPAGCSVLIPFQDPENVGAAIRSAAAFGAAQAILLAESAHPFHPKALRASGGAVLSLPLRQGPALGDLPEDLPIVALSAQGPDIRAAEFPPAFGLLAGLEGPGLPELWRSRAVSIPIRAEVESLNAAAATAVALYEWRRREGGIGG